MSGCTTVLFLLHFVTRPVAAVSVFSGPSSVEQGGAEHSFRLLHALGGSTDGVLAEKMLSVVDTVAKTSVRPS